MKSDSLRFQLGGFLDYFQKSENEFDSRFLVNVESLEAGPHDFLIRFVTMDETCFPHYTPESKQESKPGEPAPNKGNSVGWQGDDVIFWDAKNVTMVDYLSKGKTINSASFT